MHTHLERGSLGLTGKLFLKAGDWAERAVMIGVWGEFALRSLGRS
jgi:hypothetical protein